jgi:hypothetical protein
MSSLPKKLGFYYYSDVLFENLYQEKARKYQVLRDHKEGKIREYFLIKSFYALQENYEVIRNFKNNLGMK